MSLKLITAPTGLVIDVASVKAYLNIDGTDSDAELEAMIGAATDYAEQMTGRALLPQTWEVALDRFPCLNFHHDNFHHDNLLRFDYRLQAIQLSNIPVASITSIVYTDTDGATQTLSDTLYTLDAASDCGSAYVVPAFGTVWPMTQASINAVRVRYVAGYASAAAVPDAIKSWIKLQIGAMYENRESEVVIRGVCVQLGFVDRLLDKYKVFA